MHPTTVVLVMRSESVTQAFHSRAGRRDRPRLLAARSLLKRVSHRGNSWRHRSLKRKNLARKITTFIHFRRVFFLLPTRVRVRKKFLNSIFFSPWKLRDYHFGNNFWSRQDDERRKSSLLDNFTRQATSSKRQFMRKSRRLDYRRFRRWTAFDEILLSTFANW